MRNTQILVKKHILFVVCLAVAFISVAFLLQHIIGGEARLQEQEIAEGWTAETRGEVLENVNLGTLRFSSFGKGERLVLKHIMPETDIKNPAIQLYSVHSVVDLYLDGELFYNYGRDYYEQGKMVGYGWLMVKLPKDFEGKELRIEYLSTEKDSFEGVPPVVIVDGVNAVKYILSQGKLYLAIGLFLIVMGVLGMIVSIALLIKKDTAVKMFCIMLFSFLMGVYTLCNSDLMELFNMDIASKSLLEYCSFYTFVIPFTIYFADWLRESGFPKVMKVIYNAWIFVEILFAVAAIALHYFNVVQLPAVLPVCHIIMALTLVVIGGVIVCRLHLTRKIDKGLMAGFIIALFISALELLRYNVEKFSIGFSNNKYQSTIGLAAMVVVMTLFADLMSKITTNLYREAQAKAFEKMAYTDELTGILNRRGIEEPMQDLRRSKSGYALISLDMNLLKYMNDTFGHATGDKALVLLAQKLKEAFPEPCSVARSGGDEFTVVVPEGNRLWVHRQEQIFLNSLKEYNARSEDVTLSVAYGIAYSDEASSPEDVFVLADMRMYDMKKESKMARGL